MYLLPATKFTRLHLTWSVINWSRITAADILWNFGGEGEETDYSKFIGPLHELVSPLIHALETSRRSYSGRATRFLLPRASLQLVRARSVSCLIANAPGGLWDAGMTRRQSSGSFSPSLLSLLLTGPFFRRLRGRCVIQRIKLGPSGSHEDRHGCIANHVRF